MTQVRWRVEDIDEDWKLQSVSEKIPVLDVGKARLEMNHSAESNSDFTIFFLIFFFKNSGLSLKNLRKFISHDFCL